MTWLISDEARKHRAFREVWVAYLLDYEKIEQCIANYYYLADVLWTNWKYVFCPVFHGAQENHKYPVPGRKNYYRIGQ